MVLTNEQLKILLLSMNSIKMEDFEKAERESAEQNLPLDLLLSMNGFIDDSHLGQILSNYYKTNHANLDKEALDNQTLRNLPEEVARKQQAIIFKITPDAVYIATPNVENNQFFALLKKEFNKEIKVFYTTPYSLQEALKNYAPDIKASVAQLMENISKNPDEATGDNIVQLVNLLLNYAYKSRASDIHIEPLKTSVVVRLRIDGVLHEVFTYEKNIHINVVSRIKIMSRLSIDEHSASQDGRFSYAQDNDSFDVRVSILPTTEGENIVMRLLTDRSRKFLLQDLGLLKNDLEKVTRAAKKPFGMILTVGPTGAGKTTSLYAVLHMLNRPEVNIMTVEDPVEYNIDRVRQSQINPKKNLTFASGLRSIVRQDPDIIMVGEIRDQETADIAVNAAMTGHLLLSTVHANDAATAFPRLLDMGIEPFLLASSVNVVIAQRLARKICEKCRESHPVNELGDILQAEPGVLNAIKKLYGETDYLNKRIFKGKGCKACENTGYSGRIAIFEVMEVTEDIRSLIAQKASSDVIKNKAIADGMVTMLEDGVQKVFSGFTTVEELLRVING